MKKAKIKLSSLEDAHALVAAASASECDIDLAIGRYVVDAKSILGVLSIAFAGPLEVTVYELACQPFWDSIRSFIIED